MHLAGGVADDQGRAGVSFRFLDGLDGLRRVCAHGDLRHVDVAIAHGDLGKALALELLAGSRELRDLADVGGLGRLSAGVGIDLSVEDEHVHVLVLRQDMVQAAEADVVGPAVAAEDPAALLVEEVLVGHDALVALAVTGGLGLHHSEELRRGGLVGLAVVIGLKILLRSRDLGGILAVFGDVADVLRQIVTDLLLAEIHAEAVLRVILEQGVGPGGTLAFLVDGVRAGGSRAAPDGRAAGRVGDHHVIAEQLRDQAGIARLGAAGAGTGELKHGLPELAALDGEVLKLFLLSDLGDHVVEHGLLIFLALERLHRQRADRADVRADAAAHAVERGDGHGELVNALAGADLEVDRLGLRRRGGQLVGRERERADGRMRADVSALVALDALGAVPLGHGDGHAALFIRGGAELERTVGVIDERGDRQAVAVHLVDRGENVAHHLDGGRTAGQFLGRRFVDGVGPVGRNVDLHIRGRAEVDGLVVHLDDVLALLHVGSLGLLLHVADGVLFRHNLRQGEECGLQDGVVALAHADLDGQVNGIDRVELDVILGDVALGRGVQMVAELLRRPLAVDHEHAARLDILDHLEALGDVGRVVAGHEVGLVDVVRALDLVIAEAQVADGHAAGLLGVVLEVCLNIFIGVIADDLDGVLVRADGAVAAETPELAGDGALGGSVGRVRLRQGEVGHVIDDADGELTLRRVALELFIDREHGGRRGVLGAETVAAAGDDDVVAAGIGQRGDDVEVQGLALSTGLFRAVEHSDLLAGRRDGRDELVGAERTVQADLHEADLLAVRVEVVDDFLGHVADGAHGDDDTVSIRGAIVVEQLVVGADLGIDLAHVLLDQIRHGVIIFIGRLTVLEEDIAVFVAAAHLRMLRVQAALTEGIDRIHVHHLGQIVIIPDGDLLDLMRGTEAVKEVQERDAALDGGQMRHGGQIHNFLHIALGEHGKTGLAAGHNVGLITEDGQRVRRERARRHMEHGREQFAGHLVHIRDHEQQALRGGVRRGQGAGIQRTVDSAGCAGLCLHFLHTDLRAEDVLAAGSGPLIDQVGHRARRGDRVNGSHFRERIGHVGGSVVAVHGNELSCHKLHLLFLLYVILYSCNGHLSAHSRQ